MSIPNVNADGFLFLNHASSCYKQNDIIKAKVSFDASGDLKNYVFEQLWIDRGSPMGNPRYGEFSFRDQYGYSSTNLEKAKAIDGFVSHWTRLVNAYEEKEDKNVRMIYGHDSGPAQLQKYFQKRNEENYWRDNDYRDRFNKWQDENAPKADPNCKVTKECCLEGWKGAALGTGAIVGSAWAIAELIHMLRKQG